jgi:alpha-L-fucosidase
VYGEGPTKVAAGSFNDTRTQPYTAEDFRFTEKNGVLYAIELGWPLNHEAVIHALTSATMGAGKQIQSIRLLGLAANLSFEEHPDGLHVRLPEQPAGKYAYAIRIEFSSSH